MIRALKRWWFGWPRRKKSAPKRGAPASTPERASRLEPLESRIAPAVLVASSHGHQVTYKDAAGDSISIYSSLPVFTQSNLSNIFVFDKGGVDGTTGPQQLQAISLGSLAPGDSLRISVTQAGTGTGAGFANVGSMSSDDALGNVVVQGDLGSITAGSQSLSGANFVGLRSLTVHSWGKLGTTTQASGGNLNSAVTGNIGSITVQTDMQGVVLDVNPTIAGTAISGSIGSLKIGGSFIGGTGANSGSITTTSGNIGSVTIGGSLQGGSGTIPGQSTNPGEISANAFGSITIGQGIIGSSGPDSGSITSINGIGSVDILSGGIKGGTGNDSGAIIAATAPTGAAVIGSIVIHGDITGDGTAAGTVTGSGQINTGSSIGSLTIYGSLTGSTADTSGAVIATESIGHISLIGGSVAGGQGANSGEISARSLGSVSISGMLSGGPGSSSGQIVTTGTIGSLTVGQGIVGGAGSGSGVVSTGSGFGNALGTLNILSGGIAGGTGSGSGQVNIGGRIGYIYLHGAAIAGNTGSGSGEILATDNIGAINAGSLGFVTGTSANAGAILASQNLGSLVLTGSSAAGTPADAGLVQVSGSAGSISVHGDVAGSVASTGEFEIGGSLQAINITGKLQAGSAANSGSIFAGLDDTSLLGSVTVTGGVFGYSGGGSAGAGAGEIFGGGGITHAVVGGLTGGLGAASGSIVSDGAIGSVVVHGNVTGGGAGTGQISAGTNIGSVSISGSLIGGTGAGSGSILTNVVSSSTGDIQGNIGRVIIDGYIGGAPGGSVGSVAGSITSAGAIGSVAVHGAVAGTASAPVVISAAGQYILTGTTAPAAIGSISAGSVTYANILAGYDPSGVAVNRSAGIGVVTVATDLSATNIIAGVTTPSGSFGDPNDVLIQPAGSPIPSIAAIIVKGHVTEAAGGAAPANTYGFAAGKVKALIIHGAAQPVTSGESVAGLADTILLDVTQTQA